MIAGSPAGGLIRCEMGLLTAPDCWESDSWTRMVSLEGSACIGQVLVRWEADSGELAPRFSVTDAAA